MLATLGFYLVGVGETGHRGFGLCVDGMAYIFLLCPLAVLWFYLVWQDSLMRTEPKKRGKNPTKAIKIQIKQKYPQSS